MPTPATSRAASASASRWRSSSRAGGRARGAVRAPSCSTSRPAGWTARARSSSPRSPADLAEAGTAVLVATHDVEFAATFAERVVLLGSGEVVADGPVDELLAGGWYFSTRGRPDPRWSRGHGRGGHRGDRTGHGRGRSPRRGAGREAVSWQARDLRRAGADAGRRLRLVRALPPAVPDRRLGRCPRRHLAVAGRVALSPIPNVVPTTDIVLIAGYALGRGAGLRRRGAVRSGLELLAGPGAVDTVADGGLGNDRPASAPGSRRRPAGGMGRLSLAARLRLRRLRLRRAARFLPDGHLRRRAVARPLSGSFRPRTALQHRPRRGKRGARAGRGTRPRPDADSLPPPLRVRLAATRRGDHRRPRRRRARRACSPRWRSPLRRWSRVGARMRRAHRAP